ncbi:GldG family protein [Oleiharenicola sp. Vm1]|uniref:GldG family protein n=1 Tax=Oleiharenicola sp. Vm1 TaxID=3398393 RepID=UPI0039F505A1
MHLAESFRTARWIRIVNLLLQAVLFLSLFGGLNYVAQNHFGRFDLTQSRRYSLSAETRSYLDRLEKPVRIYVTFRDEKDDEELAQAYTDLRGLLREYVYATRNNDERRQIAVDFVDVYQNPKQAQALGIEQPNVVVVTSGERRRLVTIDELYRIKNKKTREAFRGEATLTAAILDVTAAERKKIYFVQGHGEAQPDDVSERGLSQLRDALRQRNFDLAALDLTRDRRIPDDAALLLIVGPTDRFQRFEEELLRDYLQTRAGRIVLMLNPGKQHGLDILLFDWGIIAYDDVIYDPSAAASAESGEILINHYTPHPITQTLINNQVYVLIGLARTVAADPGAPVEDGIKVQTLAATSESAWGERGYRLPGPRQYTPGQDLHGNLGILTISERLKPANLPLSVPGGRLAVFGTSDLITNNRIVTLGNLTLFLATVNWAAERDVDLNIPARPIERFQLALSQEELARLRLGLLLVVPGAVALLGLIVYWTRRS